MRLQIQLASLSIISAHDDEMTDLERKRMEDLGTIATKESSKVMTLPRLETQTRNF